MKTVLFAWEFGANLGHASVMAEIARGLADGVRVVVAGRDLANTRTGFAGVDHTLIQAPIWVPHRHFGNESGQGSYVDVLVLAGFADPTKLDAGIAAWEGVLDLVRPDVIVADHSPGLLLARLGRRIPAIMVGTGYTMPPLDRDSLPPLKAERAPLMPEARLARNIATVLKTRDVAPAESLPAWFRTEARVVFSYPELDPYRAFRRETLHLPPEPLPVFVPPPVQPHLFVYLGEEVPNLDVLVQTLVEMDLPITAYFRGNVGPLPDFIEIRGHVVHRTPPKLASVLTGVSHVLSAGGTYTSHAALAAGRPHLVLPLHNETQLNYGMIDKLGVAHELPRTANPAIIRRAIEAFLTDHALIRNARGWSSIVAGREQPSGAEAALAAIRTHLDSASAGAPNQNRA